MGALLLLLLMPLAGTADESGAQDTPACPQRAGPAIEAGWEAWRADEIDRARARFAEALDLCPDHPGALTGLGYVALRGGDDAQARLRFEGALAADTAAVDARAGLGILAWRAGELAEVRRHFLDVLERVPDHPEALDYLSRLPEGVGPPPDRPALVLPDTVEVVARTRGDLLEVRDGESWRPFYVLGMNLGAALPGRFPGEFPQDAEVYRRWIAQMAAMGVNTIRVYTIHPPAFYRELEAWNRAHPAAPLRLLHGVWAELPPEDDYRDLSWEEAFFAEMRRVVDLLHGRADIEPRPGHASGYYTADVSPWVLGYIIGREWEPHSVEAFNARHPGWTSHDGAFVRMDRGTPMDAWLALALDELVAYETATYRVQRPVAYTSWPTLDPLVHPTEATVTEETAIREALGDPMLVRIQEYDNDGVAVDPSLHRPTRAFGGGVFAAYHAYPYYPDFMILEEAFAEARSSFGPSRYMGYLQALKAHHHDIPVVIAEYGVPASLGNSHIQPEGLHHGGLSEQEQAEGNRRMTLEIAEAGMAGGAIFAWIDEWFKLNWSVLEFEHPLEHRPRWLNRMNAEQHYGMIAKEPLPPAEGETLAERVEGWRGLEPVYRGGDGETVRAATDEAHLWLLIETGARQPHEVMVGFDLAGPALGGFRWPGARGPRLPAGAEFVLAVEGGEARVLAHPTQVPYRFEEVATQRMAAAHPEPLAWRPDDGAAPPGFFHLRGEQHFNFPFASVATDDGKWEPIRMLMNRRRFTRDSLEVLAVGYERGFLPQGNAPDGYWEWEGGVLEVRIPWNLIHVTDPSTRTILQGAGPWAGEGFEFRKIEGIGLVVGLDDGDAGWRMLPEAEAGVRQVTWDEWTEPRWRARVRPTYERLRETFEEIERTWGGGAANGVGSGLRDDLPGLDGGPRDELSALDGVDEAWRGPAPSDTITLRERADRAWIEGGDDDPAELYAQVLLENPDDPVALIRLGLLRAWDDRHAEALELLGRLVALEPGNAEAWTVFARTLTWAGRLGEGERAWRRAVELAPDDPEVRAGLVQNLRWQGRAQMAREAAGVERWDDPMPEVLAEQLRWIDASLSAQIVGSVVHERDSDELRASTFELGSRFPLGPRWMLHLEGYHRVLADPERNATATGALVELEWQHDPGWRVRLGMGAAGADGGGETRARARLIASTPAQGAWNAVLRAERTPFDATAALARLGVDRTEVGVDVAWRPSALWRMSGAAGWARFEGDISNPRWNAGARAERRFGGGWTAGVAGRAFGFRDDQAEGYFSPERFLLAELPVGWGPERERWFPEVEVAPGAQRIGVGGDVEAVGRGRVGLTRRWRPGREIGLSVTGSSSGLERLGSESAGGYRYGALVLRGRWIF